MGPRWCGLGRSADARVVSADARGPEVRDNRRSRVAVRSRSAGDQLCLTRSAMTSSRGYWLAGTCVTGPTSLSKSSLTWSSSSRASSSGRDQSRPCALCVRAQRSSTRPLRRQSWSRLIAWCHRVERTHVRRRCVDPSRMADTSGRAPGSGSGGGHQRDGCREGRVKDVACADARCARKEPRGCARAANDRV